VRKTKETKDKEETLSKSISRRRFIKKMAYTAPVIMTFIASKAHAVGPTPCRPGPCRPGPCRPWEPPPCRPYR